MTQEISGRGSRHPKEPDVQLNTLYSWSLCPHARFCNINISGQLNKRAGERSCVANNPHYSVIFQLPQIGIRC
ncbi:hypothetical protein COCMIDRAFT_83828 [Bipolaris oryzae ATCC 44560]|uniref:Uncharacterized protein n=1 Tax=Bipolaris oryzae ATCC 44560 TaxID=930090 RepID=W6ZCV9_COCMI|nr:uncharacterized protein COCMIDRAFT_83828 [Bipolaris oryzae ATCC 44560]EUC49657.1 hypothetical protein COCMIDRAFT_83828 [Bipolaris oryzae ATCC 44560]